MLKSRLSLIINHAKFKNERPSRTGSSVTGTRVPSKAYGATLAGLCLILTSCASTDPQAQAPPPAPTSPAADQGDQAHASIDDDASASTTEAIVAGGLTGVGGGSVWTDGPREEISADLGDLWSTLNRIESLGAGTWTSLESGPLVSVGGLAAEWGASTMSSRSGNSDCERYASAASSSEGSPPAVRRYFAGLPGSSGNWIELSLISDPTAVAGELQAMANCRTHVYEFSSPDTAVESEVRYPQSVEPIGETGVAIHSYAFSQSGDNGPSFQLPEGQEAASPAMVFDRVVAVAGNVKVSVHQISGVIDSGGQPAQDFVRTEAARDVAHEVIEYLRQTEGSYSYGEFDAIDSDGYEFSNVVRVGYGVSVDTFNSLPAEADILMNMQGNLEMTLVTQGKAGPRELREGMELWGFWPEQPGVDCSVVPGRARNEPVEAMSLIAPRGPFCAVQVAVFDRFQAQSTDAGFVVPASGRSRFSVPEDAADAVAEMLSSEPTAWVVTSKRRGYDSVPASTCTGWPVGNETLLWSSTPFECAGS